MKISIIIPVYNSEKCIKRCLDSLMNQSFDMSQVEVIIINDGSTDNSETIINEYKSKLNIIYKKQDNKGQSIARNIGLAIAQGQYISFLDSDDSLNNDMLKKLYTEAINNELDIVTCDFNKVQNNNFTHIKNRITNDEIKNYILTKTGPCNMIIKKELLDNTNFKFPEELRKYEDIAVMPLLGFFEKIKIKHIDEPLYNYYDSDDSVMNAPSYTPKLNDIFVSMNMLLTEAKKYNNYQKYEKEIEYLFIRHLIMSAGLRYIRFKDPENKIKEIIKVMKTNFPKWKNNCYYKESSLKHKLIARLIMNNNKRIIRILDSMR